ncbi:MAG: hypothetical protein ACXW2E_00930 [Nitrososphaeraceae archaeon]
MPKIISRNEIAYQCTICKRRIRLPLNKKGLETLGNCIITSGCKGKLIRLRLASEIANTPTIPPIVAGIKDWHQRPGIFNHTQPIATKVWNITHNLNCKPIVHLYVNRLIDGNIQLVPIPTQAIEVIDANNIKLTFDNAESGIVQLISLSTQLNYIPTSQIIPSNVQISNDTGLITIATLLEDAITNITITFNISGQSSVDISYNDVSLNVSPLSPWTGINQIIIEGKKYYVRTIDVVNHLSAVDKFVSGQIPPQGGTMHISSIKNAALVYGDVYILTANSPFLSVDKNYDKVIDFSYSNDGIFYNSGKIYAKENKIKQLFPYIIVV